MISVSGLLICSLTVFANVVLGLVVYLRQPSARINQTFFALALAITVWSVSSAVSDSTDALQTARIASFIAFGSGFLAVSAAHVFAHVYAHKPIGRLRTAAWLVVTVFAAILFSTPLVYNLQTLETYQNGPLYIVYLLAIVGVLYLFSVELIGVYRRGKSIERGQVAIILFGTLATAVLALVTNAIIPALVDVTWPTKLGPLFSTIFVAAVAYAIIRHRLFDIRLVIARSVTYVLSIATVTAGYLLIILLISNAFIHDEHVGIKYQLINVVIALFVGFTFQPLKRFFAHLTNKFFYQDAYDPQELFDRLNKVLVASLDLKLLLMQSISIIETAFKSDFLAIELEDHDAGYRQFASRKLAIDDTDLKRIRQLASVTHHKVIDYDSLDPVRHDELVALMRHHDIAVIVRLTKNFRGPNGGLGYAIIGQKKSGYPYNPQDLRVLDTVANELIIAIQNALHYEEIQHFNELLQGRVDQATHKLRRTNEKLKELDETKDDFISMASHQLRTPLTSVKGYLSMVLEGDAGKINDTQRKMLGQAFVSSQRMVYLIADLLNVSRLRTGKFIIEPSRTDLSVMIGEELAQLVETAAARDIELTYEKPKNYPLLMLDETKTRQVIMNFVDNAIYYTPSDGHIRVELTATDTSAELRVIDDGIGVPKAEQHHLFTKFYRAGNARKARPDGTGLGLFMAKKVVLVQGGSIIFESREGKGSTFGFSFPLSKLRVTDSGRPAQPIVAKIPVAK